MLLFLISCDNQDTEAYQELEIHLVSSNDDIISNSFKRSDINSLYESIVKIEDTKEQMLVASALTKEEMYGLWLAKIQDYKDNNAMNSNKQLFFQYLMSVLDPELFVENSEIRQGLDRDKLYFFAERAFGIDEADYFLNNVENINHRIAYFNSSYDTTLNPPKSNVVEACECNKDGNCKRITGVSYLGISWEYGSCINETCYRKEYLFGFYKSSNTGRCQY